MNLKSRQLLKRLPDVRWLRLLCCPYEICNALSALYKRKKLSAEEVRVCWNITRQIAVQLCPVDMHAALDIAFCHKIYANDAYYLACAASSKSPLLTLDRSMRRIASGMGITVLEVL